MEKETHSWKLELIEPYVQPRTLEIIRCCTANTERQDKVVWPWTTNGAYSVKSGYRRIHSQCSYRIHATVSASHSIPKEVWGGGLQCKYVKINFDGAWKKDSHLAGLGVVARDAIGSFCGGLATPFHRNLPLVIEAAAGLCASKFALNHNFTDIILETDSKILMEGVRGGGKNGVWAIQPLMDEFKKIYVCFRSVLWSWVPRKLNRAAHKAAAIGIRAEQLESWDVRPPPSLVGVLLSDGLPCPLGRFS
ncbi:hypothetical protein L3X38_034296 [Prunus dulcis]|uniref:RNase H type-1 domain-containing protein n=1 Tax=Prunus dulcis TaxID=3755 RepID=A0AAD4YWQ6_PRUDU|nr:hypothetical protein L3X38_034296 [Prunus dulcis]